MDIHTVNSDKLARKLRKFYCEAKPKHTNKLNMMDAQTGYYHKNTLKNIRSAINRHLNDIIDIVRDKDFKPADQTLDGMLKKITQIGASRPTKHKEVIIPEDLSKIASYLRAAKFSPLVLRQCVWYHLSIHFVSRGLNFTISYAVIPSTFTQMKTAQNTSLFDTKHSKRISRVALSPKRPLVTNGCIHHLK